MPSSCMLFKATEYEQILNQFSEGKVSILYEYSQTALNHDLLPSTIYYSCLSWCCPLKERMPGSCLTILLTQWREPLSENVVGSSCPIFPRMPIGLFLTSRYCILEMCCKDIVSSEIQKTFHWGNKTVVSFTP